MKQRLQKLVLKLDSLSLRERALIFAGVALALVFILKALLLDPFFNRQNALTTQIKQDQEKISAMQGEIQKRINAHKLDPDQINEERIKELRQQHLQLRQNLAGMQKNLVAPARMPILLEDILRRNGNLRLVSLKNLPLAGLVESPKTSAGQNAKAALEGPIFRHGVEIVVQGNYMDMMRYLAALESMSWELYWGKAKFQIETYPVATLTLTLYTLSLDKTWLNL